MIGVTTGALLTAVWQGALLAAVVGVGLRMLPKTPAAVRFAIWFGVFLVVTALPMASLWPHAGNATRAGGRGAWLTLDMRWSLAIALVWVAASLVRAVKLVVAAARVRGLWKRAVPVGAFGGCGRTTTEILSFAQNDGRTLFAQNDGRTLNDGLNGDLTSNDRSVLSVRQVQLCVSDEVDRPTVIGFFAPKILIPTWLLEKLTPAELEQVVLHEAGHLGRGDDWMNLLQKIALVIFPLNPALAWVERRLCFERELAVDERVLRALAGRAGAATAYASCLATVAEHRLGRRGFVLALGALGRESELGRRVGRILRRGEVMRPAQARLVLGGALMGLLGVSAGLERCPELVGFAAGPAAVAQETVADFDKSLQGNNISAARNVAHEVLTDFRLPAPEHYEGRPQRLKPRPAMALYGTAEAVPLTETKARATQNVAEAVRLTKTAARATQNVAEAVPLTRTAARATQNVAEAVPLTKTAAVRASYSVAEAVSSGRWIAAVNPAKGLANGDRLMADPEERIQWMVVTEWRSADGIERAARMVMTTAPVDDPRARARWAQRVQTDVAPAPDEDSEQVYPYAAVPVQGGWLVIQL